MVFETAATFLPPPTAQVLRNRKAAMPNECHHRAPMPARGHLPSVHNRFPPPRPQASGDGLLQCDVSPGFFPEPHQEAEAQRRHDRDMYLWEETQARHVVKPVEPGSLRWFTVMKASSTATNATDTAGLFPSRGAGLRRRRFRITTGPTAKASHEESTPRLGLGVIAQHHLYSPPMC